MVEPDRSASMIRSREPTTDIFRFECVVLGLAAALGSLLLLNDFGRSLWIDEFGTLWVVEGTLRTAWERALAFQGQSPLYYLFSWLAVQGLGESEMALRLPALVAGLLSVASLYALGEEVGDRGLACLAAGLGFTSALILDASRSGRPYALALLLATLALVGFLRATRGARWGRPLFVLGGIGLFYAHYVLAVFVVGLAVAYLARPPLRRLYRPRSFFVDVAALGGLALPGLGQLLTLRARSGALSWITQPSWQVFALVLLPYVIPIVAGRLLSSSRGREPPTREAARVLWLAIGVQILALVGSGLLGAPLTAPRYFITVAVPAVVLAARGIWLISPGASRSRVAVASLVIAAYVGMNLLQLGRLGLVMAEDWRSAVARVATLHAEEPAPVLYRSGFVEDNQRVHGVEVTDAVFAPLRGPGRDRPDWEVVPLTADWHGVPELDAFLEANVAPALERHGMLLALLRGPPNVYLDGLRRWLEGRYPGRIGVESLVAEGGVTTARIRLR